MCKKQTSVSHNSTESEVISLAAGLFLDVIPALDLWDLVIEVWHSSAKSNKHRESDVAKRSIVKCREIERAMKPKAPTPTPTRRDTITEKLMNCLLWIALSQAQNLLTSKLSCTFFQDNEAVIKK